TVTGSGYIKRQPVSVYRRQARGGRGITAITPREEDFVEHLFVSSSKDTLLIFTTQGKVYSLKTYQLPLGSRTSRGRAIVNLLSLSSQEKITTILAIKEFGEKEYIFMATQKGLIKRTQLSLFSNLRRSGIFAINLTGEDKLIGAAVATSGSEAVLITRKGFAIRFKVREIRPTGRKSAGVRGVKLTKGDGVVGMVVLNGGIKKKDFYILTATERGYAKRTHIDAYRTQSRAGKGIVNIKLTPKIGEVIAGTLVGQNDEVMCITQKGVLIRVKVESIRETGRITQGVKIINLGEDDRLASIVRIVPQE
ncbi:MAG: DNA gyrase subunit A, partial [Candidatus Omnitrophota bacterium]